jgi:hypothetical protein
MLGNSGRSGEAQETAECHQADLERQALANIRPLVKQAEGPELPPFRPDDLDLPGLVKFLDDALRPYPRKPRWARSLRAFRNVRIRYAPDFKSDEVGMLAINSRIFPRGYVRGGGCAGGWLAIGPRAYVCRNGFVWDRRRPKLESYPQMGKGDITPGQYAYVRPGGATVYGNRQATAQKRALKKLPMGFFVRFKRFCRIGSTNYWKTTKNWYIPVNRLARHVPSRFHGVDLLERGLTLPLLITRAVKNVHERPGGRVVGTVKRHTAWPILGAVRIGRRRTKYYRIGGCRWVRAAGTRTAWPSRPPPGVRHGQQWVDINLERQTLTAHVGAIPVFATMVSTGDKEHPTRHGIYRVYWKVTETDMNNAMGAEERYMAESVPWSLFFWKGQALHGTYWHDQFGYPRSHGCVNLSPRDARFLFEWTWPELPDGWIYRWSGERFPGLLLRIRRKDGDKVRFFGFARKFAPTSAVRAREEDYRRRIQAETLEMIQQKNNPDPKDDILKTSDHLKTRRQVKRVPVGQGRFRNQPARTRRPRSRRAMSHISRPPGLKR